MAGSTSGSWALKHNSGKFDFAAVMVDVSAPSPAPTTNTETPFLRMTSSPSTTENLGGLSITTVLAVLFGVMGFVVTAGLGWICRRRKQKSGDAVPSGLGGIGNHTEDSVSPHIGLRGKGVPSRVEQPERSLTGDIVSPAFHCTPDVAGVSQEDGSNASLQVSDVRRKAAREAENSMTPEVHQSSLGSSAVGDSRLASEDADVISKVGSGSNKSGNSPIDGRRKSVRGIGVAQAVLGAAQELARMSQFPGVTELAGLVIILMNMVSDKSDIIGVADNMVKRCRSVMFLLQRAASIFQEVRGDVQSRACRLGAFLKA